MKQSNAPVMAIVTGLVLLALGQLAQQLMPLIGRAAYQAAAAGSYDPVNYQLHLTGYNIIAVIVVALGIVLAIRDCLSGKCR